MNKRIKTLKIALARIVKIAAPLDDIADWSTGDSDTTLTSEERLRHKTHRRGIGWGMTPKDVNTTKWIMENAPGDWVFVIPDNVNNVEDKIRSDSFKNWLSAKGYGEGHRIFVVGVAPFNADFSDPQWIVHDLVGHSVGNSFNTALKENGVRYRTWIERQDVIDAIDRVWSLLPQNLKNADETFDKKFDISSGIIFGSIRFEDAMKAIEGVETSNMDELKRDIGLMFSSAAGWMNSKVWVDVGGNKVSVIYPWE